MNTIPMYEWLNIHPYKIPGAVDYAYLRIANKLYDSWRFSLLKNEFDDEIRSMVSIVVAAYFEDVVSYTNLWGTFIRKHKELYGKYLPFYDTSGELYYADEINLQDVSFLIWSTLQKECKGMFVNPDNPGIVDLAEKMYRVLDEEFEKVPVNDFFLNYIQDKKRYEDFFEFKAFAYWLYYESYLLGFENTYLIEEQLDNTNPNSSIPFHQVEYAIRSESLFGQKTGPLALPLKEWYATMLEGMAMEKEIAIINAIENHATDSFRVDYLDETYLYTVDTEEKKYAVLRSSFEHLSDEALQRKVLITSLVKYNGEWHANGLSIWLDEEKTYWDSVEEKKIAAHTREDTYKKVLEINNGSPIAYFKNMSDLQSWVGKLFDVPGEMDSSLKNKENIIAFISPDKDISIIPYIGCYIKDPNNPFFNSEKAKDMGIALLMDYYSCPSNLYRYLSENKMLPDNMRINSLLGEKRAHELIQDNVDFIARFFKWNSY